MVARASRVRLILGEFDLWGAALRDSVTWALAEHLSLLVPTDRVGLHPWSQTTVIDQQVLLEVTEFDRTMGRGGAGGALASARHRRPGADDAYSALQRSCRRTG